MEAHKSLAASERWNATALWPAKPNFNAAIAQLGERQNEDLKVPGSIPLLGTVAPWPCAASRIEAECGSEAEVKQK